MRTTWTISELSGINRAVASGDYVEDYERYFTTKGVAAGTCTLYNKSNGTSAVVSAATATRVTAAGIVFYPGDFYVVTLPTAYMMQNSDGPLIEVECNRCGFSYPAKELVKGLCEVCIDKPQRSKY